MKNESGIIPVGLNILIKPDEVEATTASGIIVATLSQQDRLELQQTEGTVLAMGPMCYADENEPRCKIGDKVIMAAYAGMRRMGVDEKYYRLINDNDVKARLEEK